jgi:hypothetical protein
MGDKEEECKSNGISSGRLMKKIIPFFLPDHPMISHDAWSNVSSHLFFNTVIQIVYRPYIKSVTIYAL